MEIKATPVMGAVDELGVGVVGMEEGAVQIDCRNRFQRIGVLISASA